MLGSTSSLHAVSRGRLLVAALVAIVGLWVLAPSAAHASGCTNSWTNTEGGSWFTPGNWSKNAVPTSEEEVCITANGTYTVTMTQNSGTVSLGSLTVGGTSGTQTLAVGSSCSVNAILTTTAGISNGANGAITLTNGDGCGDNVTLVGPLTNAGTLTSELAHGGQRIIQGAITNTGTLAFNANTSYNGEGVALNNEGAIDLAEAIQLTVSNKSSLTNGTGGSIVATGSADVMMSSGTTFNEGAGTTSGTKPVIVDDGALNYTGKGKSLIALHGTSTLSGSLASPQSLSVESTCSENVTATAAASFTNVGTITLTNGDGCGDSATLAISAGTLTNSGKIVTEPAHGGVRSIQGNLKNKGNLTIKVSTSYNGTSTALTNEGSINLTEGTQLTVANKSSVTNGTGGSIVAAGSSLLFMNPETSFTEGAGTTTGTKPVVVDDGALSYTGEGASAIALHGTSTLSGNLVNGQSLSVESTCSENVTATAAASFTNAGAITLTNGDGCGDSATLTVSAGTLTSSGRIVTELVHGGSRTLQGNITNTGTLGIRANTSYNGASAALVNEGTLNISEGIQLTASNGDSFTNGAGGTIAAGLSGSDLLMDPGTSFNQGAGTTTGTKPVIVDDGALSYTGEGASLIALHGTSTLSGNLVNGQSLSVESTCSENATATAAASFTNGGLITLTNGDGCGNSATLAVSAGTLTNSGRIVTEPVHGGSRTLQGNITNTGTLGIKVNTSYNASGATLTNEGALNISEGASLAVTGPATVTNGAGGAITGTGNGALVQTAGTFNESVGKILGTEPVILDDAALNYSGSSTEHGSGKIALRGTSTISGPVRFTETLAIQSTCSENATATSAGSFFSAGTIELTNGDGCGNAATLSVKGGTGTLTNDGLLSVANPHGGGRTVNGNVLNEHELSIAAGEKLQVNGTFSEGAGSKFKTFIAGSGQFGVLAVSGAATVGGTINVRQISPFKGAAGEKFAIISGASLTGTFAKVEGVVSALYYMPTYSATGVTLVVAKATLALSGTSGLPGSSVTVSGGGYIPGDTITPTFTDHAGTVTVLPTATVNGSGEFSTEVTIPATAATGSGTIKVTSTMTGVHLSHAFKVT